MHSGFTVVLLSCVTLPFRGFGQADAISSNRAQGENCWQAGIVELSPSKLKARLRHTTPISSPLLYKSFRIGNAILSFKLRADAEGNVVCVQAISGHPIIIGAAIESIQTWKFRPPKKHGLSQAFEGTLIVGISGTEQGLKTTVLNREPRNQ